jgi:Uma2 family endonuclease
MGVPTIDTSPMTVEEFYAFTDTRPDEEKWELIDGEPVLNAAPSRLHQRILKNLVFALTIREREAGAAWQVLPGLGVRVSDSDRPEPDVLVIPPDPHSLDPQERDISDVIVAFEILSPSTKARDLRWKRTAYTGLASLTHYIVIAQDAVEVAVFARDHGFTERRLQSIDDTIDLCSLGFALPLAEVYRDTGLAVG